MSIPATQMRPGMIIKHKDQLHLVFKVEHRTPGNLRAFIQAKLRNIRTGAMFEERFRSADAIEKVVVDSINMEFLYADGDDYYFMNPVDYEQTVLKGSTLGDAIEYLTPNLQPRKFGLALFKPVSKPPFLYTHPPENARQRTFALPFSNRRGSD